MRLVESLRQQVLGQQRRAEQRLEEFFDRGGDSAATEKVFTLGAVALGLCDFRAHAQWQEQIVRSDADSRGPCTVSAKVAWVSGTKGTYARTTDGGKTWSVGTVPGAAKLDFRDVEAFGDTTAYLLSADCFTSWPELYLDIDGVRELKHRALACHKSQTPESIWEVHEAMHRRRRTEAEINDAEAYVRAAGKKRPELPVSFRGRKD
jgi:hypothetical protein